MVDSGVRDTAMNNMSKWMLLLGFVMCWGSAEAAFDNGPLQIRHQEPTLIERGSELELTFTVPGIDAKDVADAYLFYRVDGNIAYRQQEASLLSSQFSVPLAVENKQATAVEYYFEVQLHNGETVTYPKNNPAQGPIEVDVVDQRKSERQRRVEATGVDYTILSPDPEATVSQEDVVVALTLFYDAAKVDTANSSFQLLLDGRDITEEANASDYFYTYSPDNLSPGEHTARFNLIRNDSTLEVTSWSFSVLDPNAVASQSGSAGQEETWMPSGRVQLSARNQEVGGVKNDALSGNVRLSGQKGNVSYSAHGLLTSQEDPRLQPQNRFGGSLYIGNWLDLEAGHVYPALSTLTISGQRMQGVNVGVHAWNEALNFRFVYGKLRRGIDNLYRAVEPEYQIEGQGQQQDTVGVEYLLGTREGGSGTYKRDVMGGRIGVGRGNNFEFGLNFLKVEDDTGSINMIDNFDTLMDRNPNLTDSLNTQQQNELANNPGQLSVNGNPRPKGNFVAATDLMFSLDNDRIRFEADAAASLLNEDISDGTLSQETAEDLGLMIDQSAADLLDQISWFIIINENMETLPFRFNASDDGVSSEVIFPTSIVAAQSRLGLNYFDNNLKIQYRWVGPGYNSLANSTIRKDIAGFTISDRIQLFQNRIYLTLGYERLHDNVVNNKDATTNTTTYRSNISWYPLDQDLPRVSVSFLNRNRDNEVELFNPYVSDGLEMAAVRNFEIQDGDTLVAPNARFTNSYQLNSSISQEFSLFGISHDASVSYSYTTTKDQRFEYGGSQSTSLSMQITNRFDELPLQTTIGANYNNTKTAGGLTDIQIMGARLGASMFFFDDKLNVDASVAFTKNRSESTSLRVNPNTNQQETRDDYYEPGTSDATTSISESNSYIINTAARYNFNSSHSLLVNFRYSNIRNTISPVGIPNDRLLRARYIFNF